MRKGITDTLENQPKMDKVKEILESIPIYRDKIASICQQHEVSEEELTTELVRFLDLVAISNQTLSPSHIVDLAWHEFILFTRFYQSFCTKHYQRFIHHTPSKNENPNSFHKTIQLYINQYGQPHPIIWGKVAQEEWQLSDCGSCTN